MQETQVVMDPLQEHMFCALGVPVAVQLKTCSVVEPAPLLCNRVFKCSYCMLDSEL